VIVIGPSVQPSRIFRIQLQGGVWSVTKDHIFYGEYAPRSAAITGAREAARTVEALGGMARVVAGRAEAVIPHRRPVTKL
jgi:hypothetical protein